MKYLVDDEIVVDSDIVVKSNPIVDADIIDGDRVSVDSDIVTPYAVVVDRGSIYRGITSGETLMINGKAPYGSSEDDAVWTVYINPLDEFGNVVEEEIEVLENQIWSEIKNMYN